MFWNSTIYPKRSALSAFSLLEKQAQALLSYCHFHSFLILHYIYYISLYPLHFTERQRNCFRITGSQRQDSKPSADNNMRYSPSKSITECIKFTKRAELWTDFWQLDDIFELSGRKELILICRKRTVSRFFCLASHVLRACEARALRARKRYALPISLLILRKKNDSFAVLDEIGGSAINRNSWSVQCKIDIQSRIKFQYIWRKLWTFRTSIKITLSIIWEAFPTYV